MPYNDEQSLLEEIELDMLRWHIVRETAEELVRARGRTEEDDDFWLQIEDEAKRQWDEESDREISKRQPYEFQIDEMDLQENSSDATIST